MCWTTAGNDRHMSGHWKNPAPHISQQAILNGNITQHDTRANTTKPVPFLVILSETIWLVWEIGCLNDLSRYHEQKNSVLAIVSCMLWWFKSWLYPVFTSDKAVVGCSLDYATCLRTLLYLRYGFHFIKWNSYYVRHLSGVIIHNFCSTSASQKLQPRISIVSKNPKSANVVLVKIV